MAARDVRRRHPKKRRHAHLVPDVDRGHEGPVAAFMDHMYRNERATGEHANNDNPPQLLAGELRHGRVWAHRVPEKGAKGKAEWSPKKSD